MMDNNIDDVIERLTEIVQQAIANGDRKGYFAALYKRMTLAVHASIEAGEFDDGDRIAALGVRFANRYLTAQERFETGELMVRSWLLVFEAAAASTHTVLQQLLVGINAHINLDLGIATARTCPGSELAPLENDFKEIRAYHARLIYLERRAEKKELEKEEAKEDRPIGRRRKDFE